MQPIAGGKRFAEALATVPQSETPWGTNAVEIVIFAAPLIAALPEISTFCGTNPNVGKNRVNKRRF
jgi:hypothetical protein